MKKHIISIGRQYGCGAHEIATKLSEKLGIPYYDKEIIKRAAKDSGFDEHIFTFYDERPTRSFLYNVSTDGFSNKLKRLGYFISALCVNHLDVNKRSSF